MSALTECINKLSYDDVYFLGHRPYRQEKVKLLFEKLPVEFLEFKDLANNCTCIHEELKELGYSDKELDGKDSFIRVELYKQDIKFTLFASECRHHLYDINVSLERTAEVLEEGFYNSNITDYYRLLIYFSCKFPKLRSSLMCRCPTYIARRNDDIGGWDHILQITDSIQTTLY